MEILHPDQVLSNSQVEENEALHSRLKKLQKGKNVLNT